MRKTPLKNTVNRLMCTLFVGTSFVTVSQAEEAVHDASNRTIEFNMGVEVSESFTDNVFLTSNFKQSDFITTVSPWAKWTLATDDFKLDLRASAEIGRYSNFSTENYEDYLVGANARYRLANGIFVFGGVDHAWDHEDRTSPDDANGLRPTELRKATGYLGIGGRQNGRSFRFGLNVRNVDFDDAAAAGGLIVNNDDRDRRDIEIGGRIGLNKTESGEFFLQGIYETREYSAATDDLGFQRSSKGFSATIGYTGRIGALTGEAQVGVLSRNYDDPRFSTVVTPTFGADLSWHTGPRTRVTGKIERKLNETTVPGASGYTSTTAGVRIFHDVAQDLSLNSYFFLTQNDYRGINRTDYLGEAGLGLQYHLNPRVYLDASYYFRQRLSTTAGFEFDEHRFFFGLGTDLKPRYEKRANDTASVSSGEFYFGAMGGVHSLQTKVDGPRGAGGNVIADFGDRGSFGGVFAGYRVDFNQLVLGVELDAEFGKSAWSHNADRTFSVETGNSLGLSAIAGFRTEHGNIIYGRFGLNSTEFTSSFSQGGSNTRLKDRKLGFNVGVGAEIPLGGGFSGRIEYQIRAYEDYMIGAPLGGGDDDNFSNVQGVARFGLAYRFNAREAVNPDPVNFSGYYAGGYLSHGALQSENSGPRPSGAAPVFTLDVTRSGQGFALGVQSGYGRQFGTFYLGGEVDVEISNTNWNIERSPVGRVYSLKKTNSIGGSVRAGYVINNSVLTYVRAGVVRSSFDSSYLASGALTEGTIQLNGVRIGGGLEIAVSPKVHLQLDYSHIDYDAHQVNYGTGIDQFDTSSDTFTVALNYRF